jgi:hypothetical protein
MKPGQMQASSKPKGRIRVGDTIVSNIKDGREGWPLDQERATVKSFFFKEREIEVEEDYVATVDGKEEVATRMVKQKVRDHYVKLEEYPDLEIPQADFFKFFNYVGKPTQEAE